VMSPKSLLRHKLAVSELRDFTDGQFQTVLDDVAATGAPEAGVTLDRDAVRRVVLCSGKIYYALLAGRRERTAAATALVRVEQLYPFPKKELEAVLAGYPNAEQVYWVQEEPANMGAQRFIEPLLRPLLGSQTFQFVARDAAASPATGSYKVHQAEEAELLQRTFARA
jgi:2-oxoglutarate dehydrogenase complex dehydrogenase (E1) component-like enzyme